MENNTIVNELIGNARSAIDAVAAHFGAADATVSSRSGRYILLHFDDKDAESRFFGQLGVLLKVTHSSDCESHWLQASIQTESGELLALRKLVDYDYEPSDQVPA